MSYAVIDILKNTTAVTDEVSASSINSFMEDQAQARPFITCTYEIDNPNDNYSEQELDELNVTVTIVSDYLYTEGSSTGAYNIGRLTRTALHGTQGTYGGEIVQGIKYLGEYTEHNADPNQKTVLVEQSYTVWIRRTASSQVGTTVSAILLTQAQYDGLAEYNANTYYLISG